MLPTRLCRRAATRPAQGVARLSTLTSRRNGPTNAALSGTARGPDLNTLWVSYVDPATIRKRLVQVAQQVRLQLDSKPELVLPRAERTRHGFWFMRFGDEDELEAAQQLLNGQRFETKCGSLRGTLQLDAARRPLNLLSMLNVEHAEACPLAAWLEQTFGAFGAIDELRMPRLRNNWDSGHAFIRYADAASAEEALDRLDGTPSIVSGCNMFVDYAYPKPLVQYQQ